MPEEHGPEHDLLGQATGLGLHHQDSVGRTGDDQIQVAVGAETGEGRIQQILAILVANANRADGAIEWHPGDRQCSRGADHGRDLRVDRGVQGLDRRDDLDLLVPPFGNRGR